MEPVIGMIKEAARAKTEEHKTLCAHLALALTPFLET